MNACHNAMPFAHLAEDEAERWLRALRLHGQVGATLQALGVGEAPLRTSTEHEQPELGTPPLGADVLDDVTHRAQYAAGRGELIEKLSSVTHTQG